MPYTVRNAHTGRDYATLPTLGTVRRFCERERLEASEDRIGFLSDLAAGLIKVHHANTAAPYKGPGF